MKDVLRTGDGPPSQGFIDWRAWVRKNPDLSAGRLMKQTCPHLSDGEALA